MNFNKMKIKECKNKIEAILFTIGRFIEIQELAKLCDIGSVGYVKKALLELKKEYESRDTSLGIIEENNKWKLNIKNEYGYLTNQLVSDSELESPTIKTLAVIAYKQPVHQSEIIKIRGNSAYIHIKDLKEQNFISSERYGRTRLLKLTKTFYDYFNINKNEIRPKFEEIIVKDSIKKMF